MPPLMLKEGFVQQDDKSPEADRAPEEKPAFPRDALLRRPEVLSPEEIREEQEEIFAATDAAAKAFREAGLTPEDLARPEREQDDADNAGDQNTGGSAS